MWTWNKTVLQFFFLPYCFSFHYHRPLECSQADYPQVEHQRRQQCRGPISLSLFTLAIIAIIGIAIGIVTHFVVEGKYTGHLSIASVLHGLIS